MKYRESAENVLFTVCLFQLAYELYYSQNSGRNCEFDRRVSSQRNTIKFLTILQWYFQLNSIQKVSEPSQKTWSHLKFVSEVLSLRL